MRLKQLSLVVFLVPFLCIGSTIQGGKIQGGSIGQVAPAGGGGFPSGALLGWKYNGDLTDASGNGNNASLGSGGTANYTTNELNIATKSFRFDGSTFVEAANSSIANITSSDFTISTWVFIPGSNPFTGSPVTWSKGNFGNTGYYGQLVTDGAGDVAHFSVTFNTPSTVATTMATSTLTHDVWYNIIFVRSGTTGKIYTNGVDTLATSGTMNNPVTDGSKFRAGAYSGGSAFVTGNEADIWVWLRALTPTECATIYSLGSQ